MFRTILCLLVAGAAATCSADELLFKTQERFILPPAPSYEFKFSTSPSGFLSTSLGERKSSTFFETNDSAELQQLTADLLAGSPATLSINSQTGIHSPVAPSPALQAGDSIHRYQVYNRYFVIESGIADYMVVTYAFGTHAFGVVPEPTLITLAAPLSCLMLRRCKRQIR